VRENRRDLAGVLSYHLAWSFESSGASIISNR
jgi:hypothetical protein